MPRRKAPENGSSSHSPLVRLMEAFQKRVHQVIEVIDEALGSEDLKHRIWAVELLLKRFSPEKPPAPRPEKPSKQAALPDLSHLSDEELMTRIRNLLREGDDDAAPAD